MQNMDKMKQCPKCGSQLKETAKYCGDCGYRFQDIMDVKPEEVKPAAAKPEPEKVPEKRSRRRAAREKADASQRPRIGLFVFLTLISVAVIGAFVYGLDLFYKTAIAAQEEAERGRRDGEETGDEEEEEEEHKTAPLLGTSLMPGINVLI